MRLYRVDPGPDPADEGTDRSRWFPSLRAARREAAKMRRKGEDDVEILRYHSRTDLPPKALLLRVLDRGEWASKVEPVE